MEFNIKIKKRRKKFLHNLVIFNFNQKETYFYFQENKNLLQFKPIKENSHKI